MCTNSNIEDRLQLKIKLTMFTGLKMFANFNVAFLDSVLGGPLNFNRLKMGD